MLIESNNLRLNFHMVRCGFFRYETRNLLLFFINKLTDLFPCDHETVLRSGQIAWMIHFYLCINLSFFMSCLWSVALFLRYRQSTLAQLQFGNSITLHLTQSITVCMSSHLSFNVSMDSN